MEEKLEVVNENNVDEERRYAVYMHTSPSGKVYIGITGQNPPEKRLANGRGYSYNIHFYNDINKYGWENFRHEILFYELTKEEAEQKEIELIAYHKSNNPEFGYNIENGGNCAGKMSKDTKQKISMHHQDMKFTEEHKNNLGNNNHYLFGKHHTEETRNKMKNTHGTLVCQYSKNGDLMNIFSSMKCAEAATGIARQNIGECCKGNRFSAGGYIWKYNDENCNNGRCTPICQYSMNGEIIKVWDSFSQIRKELGYTATSIREVCKGNRIYSHGFIWRYADDKENEFTVTR